MTTPREPSSANLSPTGSHPAVRFDQVKPVVGPLTPFPPKRAGILRDVVQNTAEELAEGRSLDLLLGEALFLERLRLKRNRRLSLGNLFTRGRARNDKRLWDSIYRDLLKSPAERNRREMLERATGHYAEEIGAHFDPKVYEFATRTVPWFFSWMLNAASVRRFNPMRMTESLADRLRIVGQVDVLQNLSRQGTILLVPTHQSNIDSVLIGYVIYLMSLPPFSYGAGLNLFSNPVLSYFMSNLGCYTVDRQKSSLLYKTTLKHYSTRILTEGIHSIFFPGGGRSRNGAIESKLKLGLLGTALDAQIQNLQAGKPQPNIYIVPMVMSYHFVLEASSLIEDYLAHLGQHRYLGSDTEEIPPFVKSINFFWKYFASQSNITVRIGSPLDVFGNPVDPQGNSLGPNGTIIDPRKWLTTEGELKPHAQRDQEYTRQLGKMISDRYYRENTVLTSHLLALAYFTAVRRRYQDLDIFRLLRLSQSQRTVPFDEFLKEAEALHARVAEMANRGELHLSEELRGAIGSAEGTRKWVNDGAERIGHLHGNAVIRIEGNAIWTEDMNTLYYYRNRLSGYGLTLSAERRLKRLRGELDEQGFLA
ncbi:MAG: 1-acyl-sn-glycerol-3-phosphate acyltransferase [Bacteriovoracia bacterium]